MSISIGTCAFCITRLTIVSMNRHFSPMSDQEEPSQPGLDRASCWMLVGFLAIGLLCLGLMRWVEYKRGVSAAEFRLPTHVVDPANKQSDEEARKGDIDKKLKVGSWPPNHSVHLSDGEQSDFMDDHSSGSLLDVEDPMEALRKISKLCPSRTSAASRHECAICLSPFKIGQLVCESDECVHMFHATCMKQWLLRHDSCPICRGTYL
jgi:Ring finger domain